MKILHVTIKKHPSKVDIFYFDRLLLRGAYHLCCNGYKKSCFGVSTKSLDTIFIRY